MTAQTDVFPFRRTSIWGGFRSNEIIPIRYGSQTGACVQYETGNRDAAARTRWVWSDGACAGIDEVYVDGQRNVSGWVAANTVDVTGLPVMMITFAAPVPQDLKVTALGRGRIADGVMLENPALVLADIMSIAGLSNPSLGVFQVETEKLKLRLSGQIPAEDQLRIQDAIGSVCESIGARYSPRMALSAIIYPGGDPLLVGSDPYISAQIDVRHITGARCELDGVINALAIQFALRDGEPSGIMDLEAKTSIAALGRRPGELRAQWIGTEGQALDLGNRVLPYLARSPYIVTFRGVRAELRPGDWVRVDAANSCVPFCSGVHRLASTEFDPIEEISGGTFEIWADPVPAVTLIRTSIRVADQQFATAASITVGDQRQVTLSSESGGALNGAKCVLDGVTTRFADAAGIVTFPLLLSPPGWHDLTITTNGSADTQPFNFESGEAGTVVVPGQSVSVPITFTIRVLFQ